MVFPGNKDHPRKETPWSSMLKVHDFGDTRPAVGTRIVQGNASITAAAASTSGMTGSDVGVQRHSESGWGNASEIMQTWLKANVPQAQVYNKQIATSCLNKPLMNRIEQSLGGGGCCGPATTCGLNCSQTTTQQALSSQSQETQFASKTSIADPRGKRSDVPIRSILKSGKRSSETQDQNGNKFKHARKDSPFEVWMPAQAQQRPKVKIESSQNSQNQVGHSLPRFEGKESGRPFVQGEVPWGNQMMMMANVNVNVNVGALGSMVPNHHDGVSSTNSAYPVAVQVAMAKAAEQNRIAAAGQPVAAAQGRRTINFRNQLSPQGVPILASTPFHSNAGMALPRTTLGSTQLPEVFNSMFDFRPDLQYQGIQSSRQAAAKPPGSGLRPTNRSATTRCSCKRTKCLKLYCPCFANGLFCGPSCSCCNCCNDKSHKEEVIDARNRALIKSPDAFMPKIRTEAVKGPQTSHGQMAAGPLPGHQITRQHQRGCKCTKTNCLKRYCECFAAGVFCGSKCACTNCMNTEEASGLAKLEGLAKAN